MTPPNFDKLADEVLEDVARGDIKGDTRELLSLHGRLMYAAGIRAAADLVSNELAEMLESAASDAEMADTGALPASLRPEPGGRK